MFSVTCFSSSARFRDVSVYWLVWVMPGHLFLILEVQCLHFGSRYIVYASFLLFLFVLLRCFGVPPMIMVPFEGRNFFQLSELQELNNSFIESRRKSQEEYIKKTISPRSRGNVSDTSVFFIAPSSSFSDVLRVWIFFNKKNTFPSFILLKKI